MGMYDVLKKRIIKKANAQLKSQDPEETDVESWKVLWKNEIDIECCWNKPGSHWNRVYKYEDKAKGQAFSHGGTRVKFRRKVK